MSDQQGSPNTISQDGDNRSGEAQSTPISVDEVIARFTGQWILMCVTTFESQIPCEGYVLAHSSSREAISVALVSDLRIARESEGKRQGPHYIFRANSRSRSGEELDRAAQELVAQVMARIGATGAAGTVGRSEGYVDHIRP